MGGGFSKEIPVRIATAVVWVLAFAFMYRTLHDSIRPGVGVDFQTAWRATEDVLNGRSPYRDRFFVYLPTMTVLVMPFTVLSYSTALHIWTGICVVAVALAGVLAVQPLDRRWRLLSAGLAVLLLVKSDAMTDSLQYANATFLIAPLAVAALLCFERESWLAGCAVLALSVLIKPLVAPLFLVPLLRGRWHELALVVIPTAAVVLASALLLPGSFELFHLLKLVLNGTYIDGRLAVVNISLQGVGRRTGLGTEMLVARSFVALVALAGIVRWWRTAEGGSGSVAAGATVFLATIVVGKLSQYHYLLVATPMILCLLAVDRRRVLALMALPGMVLVVFPRYYVGNAFGSLADRQVRFAVASVLLLLPALWALSQMRRVSARAAITGAAGSSP